VNAVESCLPEPPASAVKSNVKDWQSGKMQRLWNESQWLGWLDITGEQLARGDQPQKLAREVQQRGFRDPLLLGMGGSSLCPEVLGKTFGRINHFPNLHVLDSTDPAQVKSSEHQVDIAKTLFIVSSKSGSTLEPNSFKPYFFERTKQVVGATKARSHFIAITDPGSHLQTVAEADHFLHIYLGRPSIGGRYSALAHFGMVPAFVRFRSRQQHTFAEKVLSAMRQKFGGHVEPESATVNKSA
jgi:transaldolase / glucose-6-phosphate isomerase